jgi:hypothetical protein
MTLRYTLGFPLDEGVAEASRLMGAPPGLLVKRWVRDGLDRAGVRLPPEPAKAASATCLVPSCGRLSMSRGLCGRHYGRAVYHRSANGLTEAQMVRTGKLLPARGRTVESYPLPSGPAPRCPKQDPVTRWFFGAT